MIWNWCLRCQRVFSVDHDAEGVASRACPYEDGHTVAVWDVINWQDVRDLQPAYPARPETDRVYPLDL